MYAVDMARAFPGIGAGRSDNPITQLVHRRTTLQESNLAPALLFQLSCKKGSCPVRGLCTDTSGQRLTSISADPDLKLPVSMSGATSLEYPGLPWR